MRRALDSRKYILPDGCTLDDHWTLDDFQGGQNGGVDIQVSMICFPFLLFCLIDQLQAGHGSMARARQASKAFTVQD